MKKIQRITTMLVMIGSLAAMAFTNVSHAGRAFEGTYGVCDCQSGTAAIPATFQLTINEDLTFRYYKSDQPSGPIEISGKWAISGNTISLSDYPADVSIHNKWKVDKNGLCLKSRKGFEWSRLCKVNSCK